MTTTPAKANDERIAELARALAGAVAAERERCCDILERMKPPGGRQWSTEQLACYSCLTDAQDYIRAATAQGEDRNG